MFINHLMAIRLILYANLELSATRELPYVYLPPDSCQVDFAYATMELYYINLLLDSPSVTPCHSTPLVSLGIIVDGRRRPVRRRPS